jgi:hypothetical protein
VNCGLARMASDSLAAEHLNGSRFGRFDGEMAVNFLSNFRPILVRRSGLGKLLARIPRAACSHCTAPVIKTEKTDEGRLRLDRRVRDRVVLVAAEHDPRAIENVDDDGGCPSEEELESAIKNLGFTRNS